MKRKVILPLLIVLLFAVGLWSWMARPWEGWEFASEQTSLTIDRFDRVLDEYVSLGSYTALDEMHSKYPVQTRLLIEDVLEIGRIDEPDVERRLRFYYLDSTVQVLLEEVHRQYNDMRDVENEFEQAFKALKQKDASFEAPRVYTQISCLNQSIVVADSLIGISLDKYLGADFPLYKEYYSEAQRALMTRDAIVTDAISAYLQYRGGASGEKAFKRSAKR
ncbi:MAG: gliding motility protein GldB [Bacteroidales bacterium]|nr:gliding motility protein GldB [Bacteroidales bacterium]